MKQVRRPAKRNIEEVLLRMKSQNNAWRRRKRQSELEKEIDGFHEQKHAPQ